MGLSLFRGTHHKFIIKILICFECSGRHRGYGTHISFVRSTSLDKWKRNQIKTFEIAGNKYAREQFNRLSIPMVSGFYEYSNSGVTKYKNDLANKVYFLNFTLG